jgi:hypothetical protein
MPDYFSRPIQGPHGLHFDFVGDLYDGLGKLTGDLRDVMSRPVDSDFRSKLTGLLRQLAVEIERTHKEITSGRYNCQYDEFIKLSDLKDEISMMLERNDISSELLDSSGDFHLNDFIVNLYRLANTIKPADPSHMTHPSVAAVAAEAEPNPGRGEDDLGKENRIPQEHRSRSMTLGEAGKYLGFSDQGRSAEKQLRTAIKNGSIQCHSYGRQSHVFDVRGFPPASREIMKAKSSEVV